MPDYRSYKMNEKGELVEQPPEELAQFLGILNFDASLMLRGMSLVKSICEIIGRIEKPPLIWNKNMPEPLIDFVLRHVNKKLEANPAWRIEDFDPIVLYEDDGTLKYR